MGADAHLPIPYSVTVFAYIYFDADTQSVSAPVSGSKLYHFVLDIIVKASDASQSAQEILFEIIDIAAAFGMP